MALRFLHLCIIFGQILYVLNCRFEFSVNSRALPFLCDDDLLKSAVTKVEQLSFKLENYDLRLQSELMAMKEQLLREQKTNQELFELKITATIRTLIEQSMKLYSIKEENKNLEAAHPVIKKSSSCTEAMRQANGKYAASGVYEIDLPQFLQHPFQVYCLRDPAGGQPWTIIQRRQSNDIDFHRGWLEYEHGFGDLNGNFFLGLDKIHALSHSQTHELRFELEDFQNEKRVANYDSFAIGNAQDKYELSVLGQYSGTAGDSFSYHYGEKFTTKDSDNDKDGGNCAVKYTGAWWYKSCHRSNLNGLYLGGEVPRVQYGKGLVWYVWHGDLYSLKYIHMAIRPKYYY
ncbi:fibrinogen-like protein 1 isoform X2 [Zeugodacus cucurbitae]|uniref:fibrinogen-like protein 1 isoform X2 n=1 Tax=Zeugodacus cucurbitae TaxID=28588 RepID=UPI0023D94F39|nr:fibrinogen-like protein 1 isoform X2 [Zeugodacus cucurbitae]